MQTVLSILALTLATLPGAAHAADTSCAAMLKAVQAGMAQPRIHAAIDAPLDAEALKQGMKPVLLHSIVIDKLQFSNVVASRFSRTPLASPDMRELATDLAAFQAEQGCRPAGSERLAGRTAQVWAFATDLGRGEARVKLWVDTASGLPLRAVSDEPDFDVDTHFRKGGTAGGRPGFEVKERPNGKRIVSTHAYLYGDAVKPPGPQGTLDAAALAQLQALLKGLP